MIYFHAHVHIELKGARERIGKCKKMGKTLEINCDMLNTNLSRITAYTVQKLAQLYAMNGLKTKICLRWNKNKLVCPCKTIRKQ